MSVFPSTANPIFYAQFNSRGGWRNTLIVAVLYTLVIGGLIWATVASVGSAHVQSTLQGWVQGLVILHAMGLIGYGSLRVSLSVRSDINAKLLESHHLMPLSPSAAIVGYVFGAPIQALALFAITLVIGAVVSAGAHIAIDRWLVANAMLLMFVLMIWTIGAFFAFAAGGGFILLVIGVLVTFFGAGMAIQFLPGINVLTCPIIGRSALNLRVGIDDLDYGYAVALVSQFIFTAIFFLAAARKYRSLEQPGFNVPLSLALLAAATIISVLGLVNPQAFFAFSPWSRDTRVANFVASALALTLLTLLPLTAGARAVAARRRNGAPLNRRRPIPTPIAAVAAFLILCLLLRVPPRDSWMHYPIMKQAFAATAGVEMAFILATALLCAWCYRGGRRGKPYKAWLVLLLWFIITWIVPMIADQVQRSAVTTNDNNSLGMISTLSPIGALAVAWNRNPREAMAGIIFQAAMILLPLTLLLISLSRRVKTPPQPI